MGKRRRSKKRYSDPYGKNRPLKVGQRRCRIKWCNAAVWFRTWLENDRMCPNCADYYRIREVTKDWEIEISTHDLDQREV